MTEITRCELCHQPLKKEWRKVDLNKAHVGGLLVAYKFATANKNNVFKMKDIKDQLSKAEYNRFNDWTKIASHILSRPAGRKRADYIIEMDPARIFIQGDSTVPQIIYISNQTGAIRHEGHVLISEIKGVQEFLDRYGDFTARRVSRVPADSVDQSQQKLL